MRTMLVVILVLEPIISFSMYLRICFCLLLTKLNNDRVSKDQGMA